MASKWYYWLNWRKIDGFQEWVNSSPHLAMGNALEFNKSFVFNYLHFGDLTAPFAVP